VLRRIFWPKRDKVREEWKKLHNDKFIDLYSSPNIDQLIKSRIMRWAGHVAYMGEAYTIFWWGNQSKRDHVEDPGIGGRIILRRIFRKWGKHALKFKCPHPSLKVNGDFTWIALGLSLSLLQ